MRFLILVLVVSFLGCFAGVSFADSLNLDSPRNSKMWRFEIDNDAVLDSDSNFSNGWSLQYHTKRYASWEESNAFNWVKWVGQKVPLLEAEGSIVRYSQAIGQNLITPEDIENPNPDPADLPYAGTLHYNLNWQRFNADTASNFQVTIGVLGEEAFGEEVQKFVHDDLGMGDTPEGWDTQRDSEPILNIGYSFQKRVAQFGEYDEAWGGQLMLGTGFHLGNLVTLADVGFAFRYGWNIFKGFSSYPAPPGRGFFSSHQVPKPASVSPHSYEFILAAKASALGYSVLYDGSEITDDERDVEREDFIFAGVVGLNYHHYDKMSIRLQVNLASDLLDEDSLPAPAPGDEQTSNDNSYGSFMVDFYF